MSKIAIFASGSGSNAENIVNYFKPTHSTSDFLFLTNKADAKINERAKRLGVSIVVFSKSEFYDDDIVLAKLRDFSCDIVVLAGFLWLVPQYLVKAYSGRIVNIHPALLPKFGGKGMFGTKIHEAVVENKETETGITIHYVDEAYDEGKVIFQQSFPVSPKYSVSEVEERIHALEYEFYPKVIEEILNQVNC